MEKEFIPYEQALTLKELGFDEPCFGFYEDKILKPTSYVIDFKNGTNHNVNFDNVFKTIPAPTFSQAFRWFREKYDYDFGIGKIYNGNSKYHYHINLQWEYFEGSYEEAELKCLKKLIEIVKKK